MDFNYTALAIAVVLILIVLITIAFIYQPVTAGVDTPIDGYTDPDSHFISWYQEEINRQRSLGYRDSYLYGDLCLNGTTAPSVRLLRYNLQADGTFVTYSRASGKVDALSEHPYGTISYMFRHPTNSVLFRAIEVVCQWSVEPVQDNSDIYRLLGTPITFTFTETSLLDQTSYIQVYQGPTSWTKLPLRVYPYDFINHIDERPLHPLR